MTDVSSSEAFKGLQALVVEDSDIKYGSIERLLGEASVLVVGRLATMAAVRHELNGYTPEGTGMLNAANVFFVDGNIATNSDNGRDGNGILVAFVERGIAYPARYVIERRDRYPEQLPGLAFGCSRDPGDAAYAQAVLDYNLYPTAPDARQELGRMLAIAAELLPASGSTT